MGRKRALDDVEVLEIRAMYYRRENPLSMDQIARMFRVSQGTIQHVIDRKPPYDKVVSNVDYHKQNMLNMSLDVKAKAKEEMAKLSELHSRALDTETGRYHFEMSPMRNALKAAVGKLNQTVREADRLIKQLGG